MYCRVLKRHRAHLVPTRLYYPSASVRVVACCRSLSSDSKSRLATATDRSYTPLEPTTKARPFAIERVGGRECHVSWSAENGVVKEWRELPAAVEEQSTSSGTITGSLTSWLRQMFLPINYPQSVHRSYTTFHILQFFENVFGTVVSVLCNQALLTSVGVSAEGSIFGAVAVQWIIKDGAGEVAKLFFIRKFAPYFDSHPKTFTLFGEGIVAAGSGLQIATLLVNPSPANFLLCAAGGNVFKLIGYAIWFTTHIKFIRYFSQHGNTGDVAAKDESQASIAQLAGYAAGIGLLTVSHSASYLYSLFALIVPAHLAMTTSMMRVATFELLTMPRLTLLTNQFARDENLENLMSLRQLERTRATGLFGEFYKRKEDSYLSLAPRVADVIRDDVGSARWEVCTDVFMDEKYLLYPLPSPDTSAISAFYHPDATSDDKLRSVLHAARLRRILRSDLFSDSHGPVDDACLDALRDALSDSGAWTRRHFDAFKQALEEKGWRTDEMGFADYGHRVLWGAETDRAIGAGADP